MNTRAALIYRVVDTPEIVPNQKPSMYAGIVAAIRDLAKGKSLEFNFADLPERAGGLYRACRAAGFACTIRKNRVTGKCYVSRVD